MGKPSPSTIQDRARQTDQRQNEKHQCELPRRARRLSYPGSYLDHGHLLRCQPAGDLGPVIRCPTFPGSDRLNRNLHVRNSVTNHSFSDACEVCRGVAEIVQQIVGMVIESSSNPFPSDSRKQGRCRCNHDVRTCGSTTYPSPLRKSRAEPAKMTGFIFPGGWGRQDGEYRRRA
jgi:hypothetical protein